VDVSDPAAPEEVGNCATAGDARRLFVAQAGGGGGSGPGATGAAATTIAYVADGAAGLRLIDVTNPTAPVEVGHLDPPSDTATVDVVYVVDDSAYVGSNAGEQPDYEYWLQLVDVSDPTNPAVVNTYHDTGVIKEVEVVGEDVYAGVDEASPGVYERLPGTVTSAKPANTERRACIKRFFRTLTKLLYALGLPKNAPIVSMKVYLRRHAGAVYIYVWVTLASDGLFIARGLPWWLFTPRPTLTATPTLTPTPTPIIISPNKPRSYYYAKGIIDPVSGGSGAYLYNLPLLSQGGLMNTSFILHYASDLARLGETGLPRGFWWTPLELARFEHAADPADSYFTAQVHEGEIVAFRMDENGWVPVGFIGADLVANASTVIWALQETDDYFYLLDPVTERVHSFRKLSGGRARLSQVTDRNGNRLIYNYAAADDELPIRVEDGLGRWFDFTYQQVGGHLALVRVSDQAGRQVILTHEASGADNAGAWTLRSVTDPLNQTTTFSYAAPAGAGAEWEGLLAAVRRPAGNTPYRQVYALQTLNGVTAPRVVEQIDAYGNTWRLTYAADSNRVTVTAPDGSQTTYEHHGEHGYLRTWTDAVGRQVQVELSDQANRIAVVTDRAGHRFRFSYDARSGKLASFTDAAGNRTTLTYAPYNVDFAVPGQASPISFTLFGLTRITYPDGSHDDFQYDDRGNLTRITDQRGLTYSYEYNARGQITKAVLPSSGEITLMYNADGSLRSRVDSDTGPTVFRYDAAGLLTGVTRPDGAETSYRYNAAGRLTTFTDELGRTIRLAYNPNGALASITDPLNNVMTIEYDLLDRPVAWIDASGHRSSVTYHINNRVATHTDRNGNTIQYLYDARGWLTGLRDATGATWSASYYDNGALRGLTTPLGHTTSFEVDALNRTVRMTDPLGAHMDFTYDTNGRLTGHVDRVGRATHFEFDAAGFLNAVSKTGWGRASYERDALGLLSSMTDLRGKRWTWGFSPMGRLTEVVDPLGQRTALVYDERGQLAQLIYPDGVTLTHIHNAAGQLVRLEQDGATVVSYDYDAAGRLTATDGLALVYDAEGFIVETRYGAVALGAAYDAGKRLVRVTYPAASASAAEDVASIGMTVTYTYDARDLLTRVADDLTGAWLAFNYDEAARPIEIRRSNGVVTTFTYDAADRIVRIHEVRGDVVLADQQIQLDPEGAPRQITRALPLAPLPAASDLTLTYDDAGQVGSPGYAYDARGQRIAAPGKAFAYDVLGRLVSISDGTEEVRLAYNGLGDVRQRQAAGTTTAYYYNYAIGPGVLSYNYAIRSGALMAERTTQGTATTWRYYVYTPDGKLLYAVDPAHPSVKFYHFDHLGSTLFLTDESGAITDAYAYDPYGRLIGRTGTDPQPFTYVGQYGVRQEGNDGTLYQMRTRYYDSITAAFLTRDPLWPRLQALDELAPYVYTGGRPTWRIDPQGTDSEKPVYVCGNYYWFWKVFTHHGLFFEFPDAQFNHSVDITGIELSSGGHVIRIKQRPYTPAQEFEDEKRSTYQIDDKPYTLRVDEALAILDLFDRAQRATSYGIAGGMFDFGERDTVYCWQTADMMKDFKKLYNIVYDALNPAMEILERQRGEVAYWRGAEYRHYDDPLAEQVLRLVEKADVVRKWRRLLDIPTLRKLITYAQVHMQRQKAR